MAGYTPPSVAKASVGKLASGSSSVTTLLVPGSTLVDKSNGTTVASSPGAASSEESSADLDVTRSSTPTRIRKPLKVSSELFVTRSFTSSSSSGAVPHGLVEETEIDLALLLGPLGRNRQQREDEGERD